MLVSTKGRYALRVMLELAGHEREEYVRLDAVARAQGISEKYLESIAALLVKGGLLEGLRGRGGGYRLKRRPEEYTAGEVLRLTEGSLAPVACLEAGHSHCERAGACRTLPMWKRLDGMIGAYLDSVSLADLL